MDDLADYLMEVIPLVPLIQQGQETNQKALSMLIYITIRQISQYHNTNRMRRATEYDMGG